LFEEGLPDSDSDVPTKIGRRWNVNNDPKLDIERAALHVAEVPTTDEGTAAKIDLFDQLIWRRPE
jgi:hypothetical protein